MTVEYNWAEYCMNKNINNTTEWVKPNENMHTETKRDYVLYADDASIDIRKLKNLLPKLSAYDEATKKMISK